MDSLNAVLDAIADRIWERIAPRMEGQKSPARLLTVKVAAEYLGRSEHSVRHLCDSGKLPTVRLDNRIFLDVKDLDRVIEESKQAAV